MSSGLPRRAERRRAWIAGVWLLALVAGAAASGCATSGAIHAGQQAEKLQDYDRAVVEYTKALRADPTNLEARRSLDRAKLRAAEAHYQRGRRLTAAFKFEEALVEYQVASELNPTRADIDRELRSTRNSL